MEYANSSYSFLGVAWPYDKLIGLGVAALTFALLFAVLRATRFGQALRATIQNPTAAKLVGVNTERITAMGFGLGLATAAVAGAVISIIEPFFPASHWAYIGKLMAIIVVGGLGSIPGAVIAALGLGIIEGVLQVSANPTVAAMVFYGFLFLTLLVRPQGLVGGRLAERF